MLLLHPHHFFLQRSREEGCIGVLTGAPYTLFFTLIRTHRRLFRWIAQKLYREVGTEKGGYGAAERKELWGFQGQVPHP